MLDILSVASLRFQSQSCPVSLAVGGGQQRCGTLVSMTVNILVIKKGTDLDRIECAYLVLFQVWAMLRMRNIKQIESSAVFALNRGHR